MNEQNRPVSATGKPTTPSQPAPSAWPAKGLETKPQPSQTRPDNCTVPFELDVPRAWTVCVAGTFNNWNPEATRLIFIGGKKWFKDLPLAPGRYEYRFVVDGGWVDDPKAKVQVPNPHGGHNAVLEVTEQHCEW